MSSSPPLVVADRYRLVAPLGQGGMGRVWRATDVVLHREVAIKELVPPPGLTAGERQEMRERSLREARAIARLNNINVVRVFDVLRTDADPWIVMEYVPSRSLQDTLAADGPFSPVRAAEIGLGVLNALRAAHRAGVVHRDVKPGNVLIGAEGRVVLTDFGLATVPGDPNVTRTGLVLGSPAYIAPERARDGSAGPAADLWSLGATLYAAVEGTSPFARPSAIATLAALATENPPPARNAGPMKPVLNGLLRKDPAHRINAEEAERLLLRAIGRRSKLSFPMSPTMRRPGAGRDRSALTGGTSATPVVPGPRPPVARPANPSGRTVTPAPGRPAGPSQPPVTPGRPAAAGEARPVFTPGKAQVGRPAADTPTRVDSPKVDAPRLDATRVDGPKIDATRVDGPPVKDDRTNIYGTRSEATTAPGQTSTPDTPRSGPHASGGLSRTTRGAQAGFTAADVAANRRGKAAPEHEKSLADATALIPRVKPDEPKADPTTLITPPAKESKSAPAKPVTDQADKTTRIPEPVDRTTRIPEPVDKTTRIPGPVDKTTRIPAPVDKPTQVAVPLKKARPVKSGSTQAVSAQAESIGTEEAKRYGVKADAEVPRPTVDGSALGDARAGSVKADAEARGATIDEAKFGDAPAESAKVKDPEAQTVEGGDAEARTVEGSDAEARSVEGSDAEARSVDGSDAEALSATIGGARVDHAQAESAKTDADARAGLDGAGIDEAQAGATKADDGGRGATVGDAKLDDARAADSQADAGAREATLDGAGLDQAGAGSAMADAGGRGTTFGGAGLDDTQAGTTKADAGAQGATVGDAELDDAQAASTKGDDAKTDDAIAGSVKAGSSRAEGADVAHGSEAEQAEVTGAETAGAKVAGASVKGGTVEGARTDHLTAEDAKAEDSTLGATTEAGPAAAPAGKPPVVDAIPVVSPPKSAPAKGKSKKTGQTETVPPAKVTSAAVTAPSVSSPAAETEDAEPENVTTGTGTGAATGTSAATGAGTGTAGATGKGAADGQDVATRGATDAGVAPSGSRNADPITPTAAQKAVSGGPARKPSTDATVFVPAARTGKPALDEAEPDQPTPAFSRPNRPAWTPMPVRQSPGITLFGTRLTYGQAAVAGGILLLIVVLVVVLIGVIGSRGDDGDDGDANQAAQPAAPLASAGSPSRQPTSAATTAPSPSVKPSSAPASSPAALALPTTWRVYADGTGFKVPLPKSATVSRSGSETRIRWSNRLLLIDQSGKPKPDALADWKQQERDRANRDYRSYTRVRLEPVKNYFQQAADWEFFYTTSSGNKQHAVKRNIIVNAGQAYSISWYVSPGDWAASQSDLKLIYQGFQPKS